MFANTVEYLDINPLNVAHCYSIRPRVGATATETGVDVHYMMDYRHGNFKNILEI